MTDQPAELDDALERVITAARAHLTAVKAAGGALDDERVWHSYVTLNNASFEYDQLLLDEFGEVTPWDTEAIDTSGGGKPLTGSGVRLGGGRGDPHPSVVSVRQRRDYQVPSVTALLAVAAQAAERMTLGEDVPPPETVGEAVLELVRDGDGSLSGLDVPELEPMGGLVTVLEVPEPLDLAGGAADSAALFAVGAQDRLVARFEEQPYPDGTEEPDEPDEPDGP